MTNLKYSASAPPDNFGGLPASCSTQKNSSIIVLPVPFDESSSWMKGSDKGPRAIIRASQNMELYDIETGSEVYKKGIHTAKPVISKKPLDMIGKVRRHVVKALNDDKFVVVLGGEHTVSLGAIEAHAEYYDDLSILHLDAHSDMRDSYEGNKYSHACVMARAKEMSGKIISAGIRSMDSLELKNIERKNMFYASEVRGSNDWIKRAVRRLSKNVYVTIDLDVFDPSIMPSTGTPEPGGLDWYTVLDLLKAVAKNKNIVGFDTVELCPNKNNVAPDFLAAKLIYKFLCLISAGKARTAGKAGRAGK